ncbi:MAG: hypothetical protein IJA35_01200 [Clostridia bacterium]|nr:hypothetical protein [Clostridia bacterium]
MAELTKEFEFTVDLKRQSIIKPFEIVEGDTGNVLNIAVTDDGEPASLSGVRVLAVFSSPLGVAYQDSDEGGVTISENKLTIPINAGSVSAGPVRCELQFYSGEDNLSLITSTVFGFTARRALLNENAIMSLPQYPIIVALELLNDELLRAEEDRQAAFEEMMRELSGGSRYVHIKYSKTEPQSDADITDESSAWMGIYTGEEKEAPSSYSAYTWHYIGTKDGVLARSITIPQTAWQSIALPPSVNIAVPGASGDKVIFVSADRSSYKYYTDAGVYCKSASEGYLTFACESIPAGDVTVNIVMLEMCV